MQASKLFVLCVALVCAGAGAVRADEDPDPVWIDLFTNSSCYKSMASQYSKEMSASMTYLTMGAHFARSDVNLGGFSDMFFKAASEEREHAIKIIEYLLMRGLLKDGLPADLGTIVMPSKTEWPSAVNALHDAIEKEAEVTRSIKKVIRDCDSDSDYHLSDFLTGDFLEEQYTGEREIANRLFRLKRIHKDTERLGEFLFDKKLLENDV